MGMTTCRECDQPVSDAAGACPHCGAPKPADPDWNGRGYEFRSETILWGLPIVHVAFGRDRHNRLRVATGIIAIGQYAIGLITVAQFGIGVVSVAQFGVGVWCLAQFGIGIWCIAQLAFGVYCVAQFGVALLDGIGVKIIILRKFLLPG